MKKYLAWLLIGWAACAINPVIADSLAQKVNKAFSKIGIGPEQAEAYSLLYDEFLKSRNMAIRRVLKNEAGESVAVLARKRIKRAAKKSVRKMKSKKVLTEQQLKFYAQYLDLANQLFLREAGLGS